MGERGAEGWHRPQVQLEHAGEGHSLSKLPVTPETAWGAGEEMARKQPRAPSLAFVQQTLTSRPPLPAESPRAGGNSLRFLGHGLSTCNIHAGDQGREPSTVPSVPLQLCGAAPLDLSPLLQVPSSSSSLLRSLLLYSVPGIVVRVLSLFPFFPKHLLGFILQPFKLTY